MITALTPEQQAHMRQKVLSLDIFKGRKPWKYVILIDFILFLFSVPRKYEADYLEKDTNPNKDKYIAQMQFLFSSYGTFSKEFYRDSIGDSIARW
jgi:hypothetical protein